ncbi:hypothetical protein KY290_033549 [Solanum tuberosum]|uniref:Uncharacterized protein n=1 Tax=Solanum tuberosum TaxID=4113 RepID=A0ABQ7U2B6_SOLTU|nr:hypothetical protein KY289_032909 [Solanum tuberosum]KAH0649251.1 hypothetical protein KY285_034499 [Solanum tuberosum]KAH0740506.1 hypothetical protein KY290_033549 [Solanum tuberosum]
MDCISYVQKDQHCVAGLSPTTLTRNSSVALGFSVSLSFPLSDMAPRGVDEADILEKDHQIQ